MTKNAYLIQISAQKELVDEGPEAAIREGQEMKELLNARGFAAGSAVLGLTSGDDSLTPEEEGAD